jgi:hypothetical protein
MKKLSILVALLLLVGVTVPALADVDLYVDIKKDKDVEVNEFISIYKDIDFNVEVFLWTKEGAEAKSFVNQKNELNFVDPNFFCDKNDPTIIWNSINDNSGIVGVNQATGNMNNQGNVVSLAITDGATKVDSDFVDGHYFFKGGFAEAQASADQRNKLNLVYEDRSDLKLDLIKDSINHNKGIVGVNQSVGNMNNQLNQVALAANGYALVALAETDLGQLNAVNVVETSYGFKIDTICNSINYNKGIVGVNQSAGNMNNQANVVSIAATGFQLGIK